MTVHITYFVHGTTTDNEHNKATGWLPGELSALGVQQSRDLATQVDASQFDAIFTSDLKRATDSAALSFGTRFITDPRLREANYGDFNGAEETFKDDMQQYIERRFPNGESYRDVEVRIRDFLTDITKQYDGKHIAIVAHQAPQLALDVLLNGKTWEQAIATDWRKVGAWQPGWTYIVA